MGHGFGVNPVLIIIQVGVFVFKGHFRQIMGQTFGLDEKVHFDRIIVDDDAVDQHLLNL